MAHMHNAHDMRLALTGFKRCMTASQSYGAAWHDLDAARHISKRVCSSEARGGKAEDRSTEEEGAAPQRDQAIHKHWTEASTAEKHWLDRRLPGPISHINECLGKYGKHMHSNIFMLE